MITVLAKTTGSSYVIDGVQRATWHEFEYVADVPTNGRYTKVVRITETSGIRVTTEFKLSEPTWTVA
jgi:hypothetical protein